MTFNRVFYSLIGIAISVAVFSVWKMSPKDTPEVKRIHPAVPLPQTSVPSASPASETSETFGSMQDILSPDAKEARWLRTLAERKASLTPEELAERQRYFDVVESPEFLELIRNGAPFNERHNFLVDAGVTSTRNITDQFFREVFPTGKPADYEPEMRAKLLTLIDENGGTLSFEVLQQFSADPRAMHWMIGQFQGDYQLDGELVGWLKGVSQESLLPRTQQTQMGVGATPPLPLAEQHPAPRPGADQEPLETDASNPPENLTSEAGSPPKALEQVPDLAAEILEHFKQADFEPASEAEIETGLRERFSPQRLNRAMQTLAQYGPEEGLRHLKASDPELAKQVESFLQKQRETH